jgi:hypothetical protein
VSLQLPPGHGLSPVVSQVLLGSGPLAKALKDDEAYRRRYEGDPEVFHSEDVPECVSPSLSAPIADGEFAHQQVGVEEENDEGHLYTGSEHC